MQKQLPPAFSNSDVSTITGFSPSWPRIAFSRGVTLGVM